MTAFPSRAIRFMISCIIAIMQSVSKTIFADWRSCARNCRAKRLLRDGEAAVHALIAAPHRGTINVGKAGNFFGEKVIPEFPAKAVGKLCCNGAAAATILALDGDQAEHSAV